ncbi:MAG: hypothetical protein EOO75_06300 [Myxococcales bacterium]|nr:MAG: hypothetical protein EOO75_06300 [Myxococcales bacterium]
MARRRRARSPDRSALVAMVAATVLPSAGLLALPGRPVDWATLPCLGAATPIQALAMGWLAHSFRRYNKRWWFYSALALVPSILSGFALPHALNQFLGRQVPEQVKVFVQPAGASGEASRVVDSGTGKAIDLKLPAGQAQAGQTATVPVRRGLFDWRWQPR